ncbi:MAG: DsbA family oxidoreductase [Acholeplasmataceae bacterium]|jgi:predicted DsbA family dithiol-disulfide isomerase|nr:DsbA family oxidoreductase [Acholeplasmataceae bacterium]
MMKIEIWSDFACPFCYIGKTRFEEALKSFKHKDKIEVIYKAYQLNPTAPKTMTKSAYEAFAESHGTTVEQAKERFNMFTKNAKSVGLTYQYDRIQMTNTFDAHRLAKWANKENKEQEMTTRLMKAYFTDGLNLADHETLSHLAEEVGLSKEKAYEVLASSDYEEQVKLEQQEARQLGVQGVPFFVLNRKYGISGAQQTEYFLQALEQIWKEENPLETLSNQDDSQACEHDECGIE